MLRSLITAAVFLMFGVTSLTAHAFGQGPTSAHPPINSAGDAWGHGVTGKVLNVKGSLLQVETRDKRTVNVDAAPAIKSHRVNALVPGAYITAWGAYDSKSVLQAQTIQRAKRSPAAWPPDR
jgi:hypothetical protein